MSTGTSAASKNEGVAPVGTGATAVAAQDALDLGGAVDSMKALAAASSKANTKRERFN